MTNRFEIVTVWPNSSKIMRRKFQKLLVMLLAFQFVGCAIPKKDYALIPPPNSTKETQNDDQLACYQLPSSVSNTPLTKEELRRVGDIETARFFEGGRGNNLFSQHYLLCFLNKNYQLLEMPVVWLPESNCDLLTRYNLAGIEKDRLKTLCSKPEDKKCSVCQSLE